MSDITAALILVDIQNDYFPNGRNELEGPQAAGEQATRLLLAFRQQALPLVHIQHISNRPGAIFFLPGTPGAEIHASVAPLAGETLFEKHFPNSFRETPLLDHLKKLQVSRLVIVGMMTHMCIDATTRAANDFGFECWLAQDACATKTLKFMDEVVPAAHVHAAFLAALTSYARILSVDEILSSLK